jgi:hypothetical protein
VMDEVASVEEAMVLHEEAVPQEVAQDVCHYKELEVRVPL